MYQRSAGRIGFRFLIAMVVAGFALFQYFGSSSKNPVTGEKQRVAGITPKQEIALGLQAAPQMMRQFGGEARDQQAASLVSRVGGKLITQSAAERSPYQYQFHLLEDDQTINAFALPGGQIFITEALLRKLRTEGELAGVLAHEIVHVVQRHSAQQMAKQQLTQGLTGAAVMASYDPDNPNSRQSAAVASAIGQLVNLKFGRDDELESDSIGVKLMAEAGYDPRAMVGVMEVLRAAGGGGRAPEFFSTHPNPDNRIGRIEQAIKKEFPNGVPSGLKK